MVQGLAFLSKKSWHTKNLANQEKVWMAEQKKAAEEQKTKELARQIQQEREQEELDRIAGKRGHRKDRGIDWMYEGGTGEAAHEDAKKQAEEFLLGKEYVPEGKVSGGFAALEDEAGGLNRVVAGASHPTMKETEERPPVVVQYSEPTVAERNETFRLQHEDPMFLVSQKQREKQTQQDKKRALYERVVGTTESRRHDDVSEDDRRSKKERKRDRKHRRRHRVDRDRRRRRSRSRERARYEDRDSSRGRHRRRHHHHRRSHSNSSSRSRSQSEDGHGDRRTRRDERGPSIDSAEDRRLQRSRSPDRHWEASRGRVRSNNGPRHDWRSQRGREASPRERDDSRHRPAGYGLQGASFTTGNSSITRRPEELGPDRQLLQHKRNEKETERRDRYDRASKRQRMSDQERAEALRAMRSDASRRDDALNRAVASRRTQDYCEEEEEEADNSRRRTGTFLREVAERTHGIRDVGDGSLAFRVAQNRHTNQKLSDSFL